MNFVQKVGQNFMKKIVVFGFCIAFSLGLQAAELVLVDSVGIEKIGNKTFIIHQVAERETLFGISRRYQVAVNDIIQNNEQLEDGLKMGQRIRVPYISKTAIPEGAKLHKVEPGETLFGISKKYNVSVGDILAWNKLQGSDLSVGQSLVIQGVEEEVTPPTSDQGIVAAKAVSATVPVESKTEEIKTAVTEKATNSPAKSSETAPVINTNANGMGSNLPGDWITHVVEQGETLFSITKKYEANMEDIKAWNALNSNNISVGQKLKVGREQTSSVPVVTSTVPVIVNNEKANATLTTPNTVTSAGEDMAYKNIKQTGLAEVIEGTGNHKKYLVLHRDAPVGTIMRVRNEENDITIFARVVGVLPQTGDNSKLVIKLSKAAFDQLRAVNARFPVEISY
ncbi:LysM repeat-containing protein [Aquiflexum balticum DSM 16537]|uniref:LysM repeat-containing protein n=2 Tax=Aquiflexum TaxID=280472 RepID=A0A1W2H643_9BACT|nr:LysM repeat-containing protein [Aquiflexum balticum DSM 16537]